jgi:hypothetical protein
MMDLHVLTFAALLGLGLRVSYEDWRRRKIRNQWILACLVVCAAAAGWLFVNSLFGRWGWRLLGVGEYYMPMALYLRIALHMALVTAAGLGLWWFQIWPAGDAKLYIVFGFLTVLVDPNLIGFPSVLFLRMLINIFVPAGLWVLAAVVVALALRVPKITKDDVRRTALGWTSRAIIRVMEAWPYRLGYAVHGFNIFLLFVGINVVMLEFKAFAFMRSGLGQLVVILGMYVVWGPVTGILQRWRFGVLGTAFAIAAFYHQELEELPWGHILKGAFENMIFFGIGMAVLKAFVTDHLRKESELKVDSKELQPGMILSEEAWASVRKFAARFGTEIPRRYADGLFREDVEAVKSWMGIPDLVLATYQATPFAVWVFLGSVLTLCSRKNVVYWIMRLCHDVPGTFQELWRAWGA